MVSFKLRNFDFLDSYRGLAALSVVLTHSSLFFEGFHWIIHALYFGVVSFFLLSSFLLTYRLIIQYEAANYDTRLIIRITRDYVITRFFRIYVTLIAFCVTHSALQFLIYPYKDALEMKPLQALQGAILLERSILKETSSGFLWTVPVEVNLEF